MVLTVRARRKLNSTSRAFTIAPGFLPLGHGEWTRKSTILQDEQLTFRPSGDVGQARACHRGIMAGAMRPVVPFSGPY